MTDEYAAKLLLCLVFKIGVLVTQNVGIRLDIRPRNVIQIQSAVTLLDQVLWDRFVVNTSLVMLVLD